MWLSLCPSYWVSLDLRSLVKCNYQLGTQAFQQCGCKQRPTHLFKVYTENSPFHETNCFASEAKYSKRAKNPCLSLHQAKLEKIYIWTCRTSPQCVHVCRKSIFQLNTDAVPCQPKLALWFLNLKSVENKRFLRIYTRESYVWQILNINISFLCADNYQEQNSERFESLILHASGALISFGGQCVHSNLPGTVLGVHCRGSFSGEELDWTAWTCHREHWRCRVSTSLS